MSTDPILSNRSDKPSFVGLCLSCYSSWLWEWDRGIQPSAPIVFPVKLCSRVAWIESDYFSGFKYWTVTVFSTQSMSAVFFIVMIYYGKRDSRCWYNTLAMEAQVTLPQLQEHSVHSTGSPSHPWYALCLVFAVQAVPEQHVVCVPHLEFSRWPSSRCWFLPSPLGIPCFQSWLCLTQWVSLHDYPADGHELSVELIKWFYFYKFFICSL